jgi:hypothetical protein
MGTVLTGFRETFKGIYTFLYFVDHASLMQFWVMTGTSDSHSPECVIPDDVLIQFGPPDDEHLLLEHVEA